MTTLSGLHQKNTSLTLVICFLNLLSLHAMEVTNTFTNPAALFIQGKNNEWNNFKNKLLDYTGNINTLDNDGHSLLHYACLSNYPDCVQHCINKGALINTENLCITKTKDKLPTPLHYSAQKGNAEIINMLLDNGAHINSTYNEYNNTALHIAIWFRHADCATLLINRGAKVDITNIHGSTPVHTAAWQNEPQILKILLANGASCSTKNTTGTGNTPLYLAAKAGSDESLEILLQHIQNDQDHINLECAKDKTTPVQVAAVRNRAQCYWGLIMGGADYIKKRLYQESLKSNAEMIHDYDPFKKFVQTIEYCGKNNPIRFTGMDNYCILCNKNFAYNDVILTLQPCQEAFHSSCFEDYSIRYFVENNKNNIRIVTHKKNDTDKEFAHRLKTNPFAPIELAKECPECKLTINLQASTLAVFWK